MLCFGETLRIISHRDSAKNLLWKNPTINLSVTFYTSLTFLRKSDWGQEQLNAAHEEVLQNSDPLTSFSYNPRSHTGGAMANLTQALA